MNLAESVKKLGIDDKYLLPYGNYAYKVDFGALGSARGKLILVTSINPTPAGEGKTTTAIGLADALAISGRKAVVTLREPSLGPVFGVKGGATGGGKVHVVPSDKINLHFTGDMHAVTTAHNLISAMLGNHLYYKKQPLLDSTKIWWKRALDMNERDLRNIVVGLQGNGVPREDGFEITAASEIMAILALSESIKDFEEKVSKIVLAQTMDGNAFTVADLNAQGAVTALMVDALKPNLVMTAAGTPAFVHAGPFANIAHGTNSVLATKMALTYADYVVTETGFGSDLGFEKFMDIVAPQFNLIPATVVLVVSLRAIKHHGQGDDMAAIDRGFENVMAHIDNIRNFGYEPVVAINVFADDKQEEIDYLKELLSHAHANFAESRVAMEGGAGGLELADMVVSQAKDVKPIYAYDNNDTVEEKVEKVAKRVYGASEVEFSAEAKKKLKLVEKFGLNRLPICIAKTQYSLSDNANLLARPRNFILSIKDIKISSGAGFIVPLAGNIMTMPGLPKVPQAEHVYVDENGDIQGLLG
ncbi:formate--tetrahydrofolate ligase [Coprothermobacter platensis]|uniref:formate--tetrahydrofolate ligase n=1 Tax=Coprothermobacter platensis TaxID=108819 RepID=UPI0003635D53|nr:formate--tetrahydrofolate ligase [Coprothermobacter platensis]